MYPVVFIDAIHVKIRDGQVTNRPIYVAWSEFVPFLDYDVEIHRVICSTNAVESLNARYQRAIRARGRCPTEQAALKVPLPGDPIPRPHRPW